ncbi:MAG: LD-carboxypeptidase [Acidobacteria bacterium]|nr:LD-carboxypeptidase [Acidobacteriota bacterium]
MIKPPALEPGDTIGIIAPAGPVNPEALNRGIAELHRIGYKTVLADSVLSQRGYFAGEHVHRAEAFLSMLANPDVKAILAARGGYGANYVVEYLSRPPVLRRLKRLRPRIIMGYSDVSSLLLFLQQKLRWVTFQGPMIAKDFAAGETGYDRELLEQVLARRSSEIHVRSNAITLRQGFAEGRLYGGCLSLLVATLGTAEEIDTRGTILLLEDIAEKPYRIDRMLFQLRRAGKLRGVRAVVFGEMLGCAEGSTPAEELRPVIAEALSGVKAPIVFGLRFGHTTGGCLTLPIGVRARLAARKNVKLTLLESAVGPPSLPRRHSARDAR